VILTGRFWDTVNFGGRTLTSAGAEDIFIAKFDAGGNHVWSQRYGDDNSQYAYSATVDASGNVVLTGYFWGTVDFGGSALTSAGGVEIFLTKFVKAGN
jgi:hypothetical protein